jgi:hypothetical protein
MTSAAPAYLPHSAVLNWHAGAALDMPYGGSHRPRRRRNTAWPVQNGRVAQRQDDSSCACKLQRDHPVPSRADGEASCA